MIHDHMAHFFMIKSGSKFRDQLAHFFIDIHMPAARQARHQKSSWKKSVAEKKWTEFAVLRF